VRFNPLLRGFFERLVAADKPRMQAVGVCIRKLVMLCYGVLKNRTRSTPPGPQIRPLDDTLSGSAACYYLQPQNRHHGRFAGSAGGGSLTSNWQCRQKPRADRAGSVAPQCGQRSTIMASLLAPSAMSRGPNLCASSWIDSCALNFLRFTRLRTPCTIATIPISAGQPVAQAPKKPETNDPLGQRKALM
jgi:hypothetical protein